MAAESNLGAGLGGRRGVSTAGAAGDRRALRCGLLRLYVPRSRGVSTTGAARRSPAANATRVALRAGPALTMQAGVSGALFLCREMRLVTVDHNQGKAPTRCPNKRRSFMEFTSASLVSVFPGVGSAGQRASILLASSLELEMLLKVSRRVSRRASRVNEPASCWRAPGTDAHPW